MALTKVGDSFIDVASHAITGTDAEPFTRLTRCRLPENTKAGRANPDGLDVTAMREGVYATRVTILSGM
jgi:hypothetical protein